jgi:hypothetical protein
MLKILISILKYDAISMNKIPKSYVNSTQISKIYLKSVGGNKMN